MLWRIARLVNNPKSTDWYKQNTTKFTILFLEATERVGVY